MWLITGGDGQLGRCLGEVLTARGMEHLRLGRAELDLTDPERTASTIHDAGPSVIINAAGWTAVDDAEDHEAEALAINEGGARNAARAARIAGAKLVQISTDYVFDGSGDAAHDEDSTTAPASAYGRSKLAGERSVLAEHPEGTYVVRTAWLYSRHGRNFAKTMVGRALAGAPVRVVDDQRGQPTSATDLAAHIVDLMAGVMAGAASPGVYHGTNSGSGTWFDMATEIYRLCDRDPGLVAPCATGEYPAKAPRPANSVLGHRRTVAAGVPEMRQWRAALADVLPGVIEQVQKEEEPN